MKRKAQVICPSCDEKVYLLRSIKGRVIVTTTAGIALSALGGITGTIIGVAAGGVAMVGTIPLAIGGLLLGSGIGYIISDKTLDKIKCPKCGVKISI